MIHNASLAPAFTSACLSSLLWATGCANSRLPEIKAAGVIAVENVPQRHDAKPGPWTTACLKDGFRHWGHDRLLLSERPVFDLKTFSFVSNQFQFLKEENLKGWTTWVSVDTMRFVRIVGRMEVEAPNDAALNALDDVTSDMNAGDHQKPQLSWRRAATSWRSNQLALGIELTDGLLKTTLGVFDDTKTYEPLIPGENAPRLENLPTFATLDGIARSMESSKGAAFDVWRAFAPSYAGLVRFDPEIVQTLHGCLRVK